MLIERKPKKVAYKNKCIICTEPTNGKYCIDCSNGFKFGKNRARRK